MMQYRICCINSTAELINGMTERATQIRRRTFQRAVDPGSLCAIESHLGYDTGTQRGGLRMSKDWHVSYHRSTYGGQPCVYFVHSAIEHIFL